MNRATFQIVQIIPPPIKNEPLTHHRLQCLLYLLSLRKIYRSRHESHYVLQCTRVIITTHRGTHVRDIETFEVISS